MARSWHAGPVYLNLVPHGGGQQRPHLTRSSNICSQPCCGGDRHDPDLGRPIAAPLERRAELLGVDRATVREVAATVEPYIRADGTRIWCLMQLERQLRPEAYGRGGYLDRRRTPTADA